MCCLSSDTALLRPSKGTSGLGNQRTYFAAAAPARPIIVFHRGLNAKRLAGTVVEAHVTTARPPTGRRLIRTC